MFTQRESADHLLLRAEKIVQRSRERLQKTRLSVQESLAIIFLFESLNTKPAVWQDRRKSG